MNVRDNVRACDDDVSEMFNWLMGALWKPHLSRLIAQTALLRVSLHLNLSIYHSSCSSIVLKSSVRNCFPFGMTTASNLKIETRGPSHVRSCTRFSQAARVELSAIHLQPAIQLQGGTAQSKLLLLSPETTKPRDLLCHAVATTRLLLIINNRTSSSIMPSATCKSHTVHMRSPPTVHIANET